MDETPVPTGARCGDFVLSFPLLVCEGQQKHTHTHSHARRGHFFPDCAHPEPQARNQAAATKQSPPRAKFGRAEASNNAIWVVSKSLTADVVPEARFLGRG